MKKFLIVLIYPPVSGNSESPNEQMIKAIGGQLEKDFSLVLTGQLSNEERNLLTRAGIPFQEAGQIPDDPFGFINRTFRDYPSDYLLFIDAREHPVVLNKACLSAFALGAERNPRAAMIYGDYGLDDGNKVMEKKLLFHHIGRIRDNQDYGCVFLVSRNAWEQVGGFDEQLEYKSWYDLRLRLSEKGKLIRIGNKYSGSLYTVLASDQGANVFDYLLAGKDAQLEAEEVLSAHLKRIGAWLAPGNFKKVKYDRDRTFDLDASIIIPVGHRPEFIGTAIESIQAQTHQKIEAIIVVNGGEHDPTADEVRKYMPGGSAYDPVKPEIRMVLIDINNIGLCLNLGVKQARGKYYVQLDSDDRLKPDAVEKILKIFHSDPATGMVIGSYEVWEKKADGKLYRMDEIPVVTHDEWTPENGRNNLLRINGAGAPRSIPIELIKAMGYFSINDDAYARNYGEDYEMVNKIAESFVIGRIYDPIYEVVRHAGGTDHSISQEIIDRNDEAKDDMRREAIQRRVRFNNSRE